MASASIRYSIRYSKEGRVQHFYRAKCRSSVQSIMGATLKRHPLSSFSFSAGVDTCALFRFDAGPLRAIREDRRMGGSIEGVRASA
ncbi:MAG: hypothetical protein ACAH20_09010 [Methylobacteriaceae bacterium]